MSEKISLDSSDTIYKILPNTPKFLINIEHYFKIKT